MKQKNFLLFLVGSFLIMMGWMWLQGIIWPRVPKQPQPPPKEKPEVVWPWRERLGITQNQIFARLAAGAAPTSAGLSDVYRVATEVELARVYRDLRPNPEVVAAAQLLTAGLPTGFGLDDSWRTATQLALALEEPALQTRLKQFIVRMKEKEAEQPAVTSHKPLVLGDEKPGQDAKFNLRVVLDPRGAGVRSVVLNRFQEADKRGKPVWQQGPDGKKVPHPLELVPEPRYGVDLSNLLYHFGNPEAPSSLEDDRPLETLGKVAWQVKEADPERVVFETTVQDVILSKIYTLKPGDYHVGLEVKMQLKKGAVARKFRYQLASAHGLPVEGAWYTSTFRNAVIGRVDNKDGLWRTMEELRDISRKWGGDLVVKETGDEIRLIRYAGVAVQYFANLIVVDDEQEHKDFLARARATLETAVLKGKIKSGSIKGNTFELSETGLKDPPVIHLDDKTAIDAGLPKEGQTVTVVYTTDSHDRLIALEVLSEANSNRMFVDDITVRVTTEPIELQPDKPVVHKYLLYNGPVKVMLLKQLGGDKKVDAALVKRYQDTLHLDTLTDYHSSGWFGTVASKIGWTWILIKCTNLMHSVLYFLHTYIMPLSWGLAIILLTVVVRGLMFPISRKQALTSIKMQELAPELKKMQEKHQGDRQAMGLAQMELYRKHGINPLGSCWLLLLQMPIFLGLYYALQESIHFRLAPFFWIDNLAAPDMLFWWSESIPWISRPQDYGWFLYLGPYFNLLPVIAVALMIMQQKLTMPPPTDEQQVVQQKMMKYMMIFFGVLFYKVAAGLCVYFIASSLWGFAERKLLPKRKTGEGSPPAGEDKPGLMGKFLGRLDEFRKQRKEALAVTPTPTSQSSPAVTDVSQQSSPSKRKEARKKRKQERARRRNEAADSVNGPASLPSAPPRPSGDSRDGAKQKVRSWWSSLREWWADVLKKAQKR